MQSRLGTAFLISVALLAPRSVAAQTAQPGIEGGGHVAVLRLSEFDVTDLGVGVNATIPAGNALAVDGAVTWFPGGGGDLIDGQRRTLGLFGVRSGIRRGRVS